jgi:HAD superfamily hydrolase (TIGR01509 family)
MSALLFDLDGTLVMTDHVYVKVWNQILVTYQISIDESFFNEFIKGSSDSGFLSFLIPNVTDSERKQLSEMKDELFIEMLTRSSEGVLVEGAMEFVKRYHETHPMAIVTNCNRRSAEFILRLTGLDRYIKTLVASDDCQRHKPHPEPYLMAIEKLGVDRGNCVIFEDSLSGYTSAKKAGVLRVCCVGSAQIGTREDFRMRDFCDLTLEEILHGEDSKHECLGLIHEQLANLPIAGICQRSDNVKTGYICDIDRFELEYRDGSRSRVIVKKSNSNNHLAETATHLNMYQNEVYFYQEIAAAIDCLSVPKCYGVFYDHHCHEHGIILEDLTLHQGKFNADLNRNVTLLLRVVGAISRLHHRYIFQDEGQLIKAMKRLKKVNQIKHYSRLVESRYQKFLERNRPLLSDGDVGILDRIFANYQSVLDGLSQFPLSFCHGDLKSPNIFYRDLETPYFLDWQYIHLNKGVSDIAFLLVESIDFDHRISDLVLNYYYQLNVEANPCFSSDYERYLVDFKRSLCAFPFFVCVWFNSESSENLLDKAFPIRFMKNLLQYYGHYLADRSGVFIESD